MCHKVVLAAHSEFLREMLKKDENCDVIISKDATVPGSEDRFLVSQFLVLEFFEYLCQ